MSAAAEALHYAHTQDIIHRDVKPANLILCVDGRIMLADFGLAKSSEDHSVTMTGSVVGTLRYLSPEQAMAKRAKVDHRTDIWSLGATMYELLCYQPAFPGDDQKDILSRILTRDPSGPRKLNAHIPPELDTICMKCLEKAPAARYETAQQLADDLKRYVNDLPIAAKRPSAFRRAAKFVRRHKAPVAVSTAAVLLLTMTAFWRSEMAARREAQAAERVAQVAALNDSAIAFVSTSKAEKNWLSAEEELKRALAIDPRHPQTLLTLAWLKLEHYKALPDHAGLKSQEQVVEVCNKILSLDGRNVRALDYLGIALRRLERYDEAIPVLQKSVELKPEAYASWSNLGTLYAVTGDLETAEEHMRKGVELAGKEQDKWHAVAWRNLATLEWLLGKPQAAEHIANALYCSPIDTQSWVIRSLIGLGHSEAASHSEALDDAKHADRLANFTDPRAKRALALAYLKNGEPERAIEQARLAIEMNDEPAINQLILAAAAADMGRLDAAGSYLKQAESAWPEPLRKAGSFKARADTGDLWIERADDRLDLAQRARAKLASIGL
jgi:tetratricopeptide (TPR) repeat protein